MLIEIRELSDQDIVDVASLITELGYPTAPAQMAQRIGNIKRRADFATFVAECDARVAGMVGASISPYYEHDGNYGRIVVLVVSKHFQKRNIGQQLVNHAEKWIQSRGAKTIIVNSGQQRSDAHRFYERLGYKRTGIRFVKTIERRAKRPAVP